MGYEDHVMEPELIRRLIEGRRLVLFSQKILNQSYEHWYEVLVRLEIAGKMVPADAWIPSIVDDESIMIDLDHAVLSMVLDSGKLKKKERCWVNLFPVTIAQDGFPSYLSNQCQQRNISPNRLCLEVTEYADLPEILCNLHQLSKLGFCIALDDVGAGASNLRALGHLVSRDIVKFVKIDHALTQSVSLADPRGVVCLGLINLCKQMGVSGIICECHSDIDRVDRYRILQLREWGAMGIQGFGIEKPKYWFSY